MNWERAKEYILKEQGGIKREFGLEIKVYGSGSQGYLKLDDFLNEGEGDLTKTIKKQMYEYWAFLILINVLSYGYKLKEDEKISYQASRGRDDQHPKIITPRGGVFIEPYLPTYDDEKIMNDHEKYVQLLKRLSSKHIKPDFIITKNDCDSIPWGAWTWIGDWKGEDGLKKGEMDFRRFSDNIKYIIECKEGSPTEKDLAQVLWYSLAYNVPTILIVQDKLNNSYKNVFEKDLEYCRGIGNEIKIIEDFKIGNAHECINKLGFLL